MIRIDLESVRVIGRTTMGVTLINLEEDEKVVDIDTIAKSKIDDEFQEEDIS
jgi:DNA gyrase subunit A